MSNLNKVQLIGRAGKDPEFRTLNSGEGTASISLATSETWKDKSSGEKKEATEWHRLVFFGRLAEIVNEYVRKGSLIYVEGSIKTRKYTPQGSDEEKSITEIKVFEMKLLGSKADNGGGERAPALAAAPRPQQRAAAPKQDDIDSDVPF